MLAIAVLKQVGFDLTSEEMADILWLATQLDHSEPDPKITSSDPPTTSSDRDLPISPTIPSGSEPQKAAKVYPPSSQNSPKKIDTVGSMPIKIPAATALPDALDIGRSLRPLMRKVPSPIRSILDEEATVRRIVEQKICLPVLKAAPTRWLELALVIEHTSSTAVWQPTLKELQHLLEHHGAFRDVRTWRLTFEDETPKLWTKNNFGKDEKCFHSPQEILDSSHKRLILLVSDCVSPTWYNKTIYPLLRLWGTKGMVGVLQLLPECLWYRTALEAETYVQIRSLTPGVPNTQLKATNWEGEEINNPFKLPVITLEPDSLYNWSQVIAGNGSVTTTGIVLTSDSTPLPEEEDTQLTPLQRVSRFRATASPTAQKLAGLLAAIPVSLPIVHLIQRKMLPQSRQIHVAEVFMSGLLKPIQTQRKLEYQEYEFIEGVREKFIASVPISQNTEVIYKLSEYIAKRLGLSIKEFEARLLSPNIANQDSSLRSFATVTAQVLKQLGGEYLDFAEEIASYLTPLEQSRHLLWQYGNTKIYSLLTDSPWLLTLDALIHEEFASVDHVKAFIPSVLGLADKNKFTRLVVSLDRNESMTLSLQDIVPQILQTIKKILQISLHSANREITLISKAPETITILNQVAQRLFPQPEPSALSSFSFETVTVNRRGEIIKQENHTAQYFTEILPDQVPLEMVYIPGGTFLMGSPEGEGSDSERPQHQVNVPAFFMGKYPITQEQWKAIANLDPIDRKLSLDPSYFKGNNRPVERVNWYDAVEFCKRLSKLTEKEYRLPSEAEWEYACRAGTTTPFYFGETITSELANYNANYPSHPHSVLFKETGIPEELVNYNANYIYADEPQGKYLRKTSSVGYFPPNAFGLYDMHGNVWEWCLDNWHENYVGIPPTDGSAWLNKNDTQNEDSAILRGGSWYDNSYFCRSAFRFDDISSKRSYVNINFGFRVVCVVERTLSP